MIFVREVIDTNSNMQSKLMINPGTLLSGAMFRRAKQARKLARDCHQAAMLRSATLCDSARP